jgi:hypothetical protein
MARARGANALLAGVYESGYGTVPGSGFFKLPFVSSQLGEEQALLASNLLGLGREPQDPSSDVINNDGDVVVPVDLRNIGYWLKLAFGAPVTAAALAATEVWTFTAQPAANSTITVNGTVFTFVSGAPSGNQIQIGANLAATLTAAAVALNASVVTGVAQAAYAGAATTLTATFKTLGPSGNAFTGAAQAAANATCPATASGGANTHTFTSGATALPSMSLEVGLPEIPSFGMNFGARLDKMKIAMARSGLLDATISLVCQGETTAAATLAGTPSTQVVQRFIQATGQVRRGAVQLASVVSADFTYMNNIDKVDTIRPDGRIEDADPGMVGMVGAITTRFRDTTLLDQATSETPCELDFGWTIGAGKSLLFTANRVFLPKVKRPVTGPGGIQTTFNFQAAFDSVSGSSCIAVLTNDVTSY